MRASNGESLPKALAEAATEIAQLELVGSEYDPKAEPKDTKAAAAPKPKAGVGGRLRAAADRLRGKKDDAESGKAAKGGQTKGRGAKRTTPQKAG